jgi:hypothetical protein
MKLVRVAGEDLTVRVLVDMGFPNLFG